MVENSNPFICAVAILNALWLRLWLTYGEELSSKTLTLKYINQATSLFSTTPVNQKFLLQFGELK